MSLLRCSPRALLREADVRWQRLQRLSAGRSRTPIAINSFDDDAAGDAVAGVGRNMQVGHVAGMLAFGGFHAVLLAGRVEMAARTGERRLALADGVDVEG